MKRLGGWWSSLSLWQQLAVGAAAAVAMWLFWGVFLVAVMYFYWEGAWPQAGSGVVGKLGQVGDLFGGVNALFAAFAFVGVAIAAYYQHATFQLQVRQNARQSFEPLFFKLLEGHRPPDSLEFPTADAWGSGWDTYRFDECMSEVRRLLSWARRRGPQDALPESWNEINETLYGLNDGVLAPYFRRLYHLFKFIAESDLEWSDKVRHANIARALLNKDELLLLLLNCASPRSKGFKPLVEGFGLLKHIPRGEGTPTPEERLAAELYDPTAVMDATGRERYWAQHPEARPTWAR